MTLSGDWFARAELKATTPSFGQMFEVLCGFLNAFFVLFEQFQGEFQMQM